MQAAVPGLKSIYGIASNATFEANKGVRHDHEPAQRGALPNEEGWDARSYLRNIPTVFDAVRNEFGPSCPVCTTPTPHDPRPGRPAGEVA